MYTELMSFAWSFRSTESWLLYRGRQRVGEPFQHDMMCDESFAWSFEVHLDPGCPVKGSVSVEGLCPSRCHRE